MKKISILLGLMLALVSHADVYTTEFRSGLSLMSTYESGDFSATLSSSEPSLDILGSSEYDLDNDPVVRAIGSGTISLSFNQTVTSISFDIGGLDSSDSTTFSTVPSLDNPQNTTQHFSNAPTLNGTTVQGTSASGTRVTFSSLDTTSLSWNNSGTWIFYDNFEFSTDAVPEPALVVMLGIVPGIRFFIRRRFFM